MSSTDGFDPLRSPSPELSYPSSTSSEMDVEEEVTHHYCNPMLLVSGGDPVTYLSGPFYVVLMDDVSNIVPFDFRDYALQLKQKGAIVNCFFTLDDAKLAYRMICEEIHPSRPHSDNPEYHCSLIDYLENDPPSYNCSPLPPPRFLIQEDDDDISLPDSEIPDGSPMPSTPVNSPPASSLPSPTDTDGDVESEAGDSIMDGSSGYGSENEVRNIANRYATNYTGNDNNFTGFSLLMAQDSDAESDSTTMESLMESLRHPSPDHGVGSFAVNSRGQYYLVRMQDHRSILFSNQSVALVIFAETYKKIHYGDILSSHGVVDSVDAVVRNTETRLYYAVRGEFIKRFFSDRFLAQRFFDDEARGYHFVDMLITTVREEARVFAGLC